jgi:transcription antitermination factor NusG
MAQKWYAYQSHPNKEIALSHQVQARGFEFFLPQIRVQPVNPRARKIRPYFPGYLFIHIDLIDVGITDLNRIPYSKGVVTFGGEPAIVPDHLIQSIQQRLTGGSGLQGGKIENLRSGEQVRIEAGPFAGYEAIFDTQLSGSERVRVLLKMLSDRHIMVELNSDQISKKRSIKK